MVLIVHQLTFENYRFSEEAIKNKVNNYRTMLMGHGGKLETPVDKWGRPA